MFRINSMLWDRESMRVDVSGITRRSQIFWRPAAGDLLRRLMQGPPLLLLDIDIPVDAEAVGQPAGRPPGLVV